MITYLRQLNKDKLLSFIINRIVLRDSFVLIALKSLNKVLFFAFVLVVAKYLGQEDFGDFVFIVGVINLVSSPIVTIVSLIVARIGCSFPSETYMNNLRWFYQKYRLYTFSSSLFIIILFFMAEPWLIEHTKIRAHGSFSVAGVIMAGHIIFSYNLGILQAIESFRAIGILFFLIGCLTLAFGIGMVWWNLGIIYAYSAQALAFMISMAAMVWVVNTVLPKRPISPENYSFSISKFSILIFISIIAFFILNSMDVIMVKLLFNRMEAGYYTRLEVFGKIFFVLSTSLATVLFPRVSKIYERDGNPTLYLIKGTASFFILSIPIMLVFLLFSENFFSAIYEDSFAVNTNILLLILIANVFQSYIFLLINYEGAVIDRGMVYWIGGILAVQSVMFSLNHGSLYQIAINILVPSSIGSVVLLTHVLFKNMKLFANGCITGSIRK